MGYSIHYSAQLVEKNAQSGEANPLMAVLGGLLAQSGGLQGLASKFAQSGQGNAFQSWVGMDENQPVSNDQIQKRAWFRAGQRDGSQNGSGSCRCVNLPG